MMIYIWIYPVWIIMFNSWHKYSVGKKWFRNLGFSLWGPSTKCRSECISINSLHTYGCTDRTQQIDKPLHGYFIRGWIFWFQYLSRMCCFVPWVCRHDSIFVLCFIQYVYKIQPGAEHAGCHYHDDVIKWKHFRVTGHLCGEFTGERWIPRTKASDAEFWCFLWSVPEYTVE